MFKEARKAMCPLPAWDSEFPPLYDIQSTYLENAEKGPFFQMDIPDRQWPPESKWYDFFGFKVASPIGVPAGPLLNAKWINLAGKLGFDIVCYKTIRSTKSYGHPLPNIVYVEAKEQLIPRSLPESITQKSNPPKKIEELAITNSFGMPSRSFEYLEEDIAAANHSLQKGQVMIVSVVGTAMPSGSQMELTDDFVKTAKFAKNCGAKIIEANYSCPNIVSGEGCIYYNPLRVYEISSALVRSLGDTPLIIKLGLFPTYQNFKESLIAAARAGVQGICGINTIGMKVLNAHGSPALDPNRVTSGICGAPIHQAALTFIQEASRIIQEEKLDLKIIGTGGIVLPEHFNSLLNAGAIAALSGTGMMWDPYLAMRYHKEKMNE